MQKGNEPGKFRQLDEIMYIHGFPGYQSLTAVAEEVMQVVCDVKGSVPAISLRIIESYMLRYIEHL